MSVRRHEPTQGAEARIAYAAEFAAFQPGQIDTKLGRLIELMEREAKQARAQGDNRVDIRVRRTTIASTAEIARDSGGRDIIRSLRERPASAGAEGATAPETLRQKDRRGMKLWKAAAPGGCRSPTE